MRSISSSHWIVIVAAALVACTAEPSPAEDAAVASCDPDRACPEGAPVWGGPCEGALSCPFEACGPGGDDLYECVDGEWSLTVPGCLGGSLPLAEYCSTPFTGALSGARLWISADGAGAAELSSGDSTAIAFGAQGLAMVPFRIHLDGVDPMRAPACVRVTTTLTLDGVSTAPSVQQVRLRCGSSLRIQEILPDLPCELREYAIVVAVEVEGVGSISLDLTAMGGSCPRGGGMG